MEFRKIKKYFETKILFKIEETDTIILQAKATLSSQYKEKVITMLKKELGCNVVIVPISFEIVKTERKENE